MGFWADDGQVGIYRFVHRISTHKRAWSPRSRLLARVVVGAHSPLFVNQARADSGSRLAELQVAIGAESEPLLPTTSHG